MNRKHDTARRFYINVVVWGSQFRNYFLDYCLPSLLSPGNIPCLRNKEQSKFLICTTREDWKQMEETAIFRLLKSHIEAVFMEIPLPNEGVSGCQHMGVGHKMATRKAYDDGACFIALTPDLVVSDGSIERVQTLAESGCSVVLVAALRFAEEPFFRELENRGFVDPSRRPSQTGNPVSLTGRDLTSMAMKSFHSETENYDWDNPFTSVLLPLCLWKVNREEGMVLHSFSWAPFLLDYSVLGTHDDSTFDQWTFDGDYVHRNFSNCDNMHVVTDSDEIMMISWAPAATAFFKSGPVAMYKSEARRNYCKRWFLAFTYAAEIMDPLKRRIFPVCVKWHAGELTDAYAALENKVRMYVEKARKSLRTADLSTESSVSSPGAVFFIFYLLFMGICFSLFRRFSKTKNTNHGFAAGDCTESGTGAVKNDDGRGERGNPVSEADDFKLSKLLDYKKIKLYAGYLARKDKLWRVAFVINDRIVSRQ